MSQHYLKLLQTGLVTHHTLEWWRSMGCVRQQQHATSWKQETKPGTPPLPAATPRKYTRSGVAWLAPKVNRRPGDTPDVWLQLATINLINANNSLYVHRSGMPACLSLTLCIMSYKVVNLYNQVWKEDSDIPQFLHISLFNKDCSLSVFPKCHT